MLQYVGITFEKDVLNYCLQHKHTACIEASLSGHELHEADKAQVGPSGRLIHWTFCFLVRTILVIPYDQRYCIHLILVYH